MKRTDFTKWLKNESRPPLVMGVLNVTPDSFSDGGLFASPRAAVSHALQMIDAGASIIDIGGESTRPGAQRVAEFEQIQRVVPIIERIIKKKPSVIISIDTTRAKVAAAAIDAGAAIVNDISGGREDPDILPLVARLGVPIILMHMQGDPATMQARPSYLDVVAEIRAFLKAQIDAAVSAGIDRAKIIIDPGIGFGKTAQHNLDILRKLDQFKKLNAPLLVGASRKRFIGEITGRKSPGERIFGTAGAVAVSIQNGADIVRVHDVPEMVDVVKVVGAICR